jgi:mono/diheme cytochrome c family protein
MIARLTFLPVLTLATGVLAAELPPPAARPVDFQRDIQPLFEKHCVKCHGPEKQKGGWRADVKASALRGGDNFAPNVLSGKSAESPLIHFVAGLDPEMVMPQKGDRLSAEQIGLLRAWIDQGADWPAALGEAAGDRNKHWAFQPLTRPPVPETRAADRIRTPIDAFITAKLAEHGLALSPEVDRATLARRVYLVMHGLPPTPEEVAQFVEDRSPRACEDLIERVLASPRYGERWAQHWLDVVRYADTAGYEYNNIRKNAWPYRDYVIRALNEDRPWDRMIFEQLAGDTLGEDAATGFLVTAPLPSPAEVGKEPAAIKQARYNSLDEMLQNVGASMLGLTLQCARCHNHKFDPVSTEEYYSLIACLEGVKFGERDWRGADQSQTLAQIRALEEQLARNADALAAYPRSIEADALGTTERFRPVEAKFIRLTITKTDRTSEGPAFDEIEVFAAPEGDEPARNVALDAAGAKATSSGAAKQLKTDDAHLNDGRYGAQSLWIANKRPPAWVQIEFPQPVRVDHLAWSRDRELERDEPEKAKYRKTSEWVVEYAEKEPKDWKSVVPASVEEERLSRYRELTSERKRLLEELAKLGEKPRVFAGNFEQPGATHVFLRGDPEQPKAQVRPASVAVLGRFELPSESRESERRVALAR